MDVWLPTSKMRILRPSCTLVLKVLASVCSVSERTVFKKKKKKGTFFVSYWSLADYKCCDSFRWTAKGLSHAYTCIHAPPNSPPIQAATRHGAEFPVLSSRSLLVPMLSHPYYPWFSHPSHRQPSENTTLWEPNSIVLPLHWPLVSNGAVLPGSLIPALQTSLKERFAASTPCQLPPKLCRWQLCLKAFNGVASLLMAQW